MLISESGLVRAIKRAYKRGGYVVADRGGMATIYTESWCVQCQRVKLPRKVLATIVEHAGVIPDENPVAIVNGSDPQMIMQEVAAENMDRWRGGQRGDQVTMVPVILNGYQIYQPPGGGACWGVPLMDLDIIERVAAEYSVADVLDDSGLLWAGDGETVILEAVRKATSSWAKGWERAAWSALEELDLHREED